MRWTARCAPRSRSCSPNAWTSPTFKPIDLLREAIQRPAFSLACEPSGCGAVADATVPCLGAMIAPELLGGGTRMMLGNLIFRQFSDARNWPFGAALSLVLMALGDALLGGPMSASLGLSRETGRQIAGRKLAASFDEWQSQIKS